MLKDENPKPKRVSWLRAAVLGANDGIVSTASLILGVAASDFSYQTILVAGIAGLVAGGMSMAAGEYVSVQSQSDSEKAQLKREREELEKNPEYELKELAHIYVNRGLTPELAVTVAQQLMEKNALAAHARDELGISELTQARPYEAAIASALSFSLGGSVPLLMTLFAPIKLLIPYVSTVTLFALALLGVIGAKIGGAPVLRASIRVTFWGALAMLITSAIGSLVG